MSSKKAASPTNRAPVDLLIDVVAIACILVIAGRPDALAITVSAVIIALAVVVYRATVGAKAYLASTGRGRVAVATDDQPASTQAPATPSTNERVDRSSWLRE